MDLASNPFFVLELDPQCSRVEVEREGQKLLAMLAVGFADAACYRSPLGERLRTAEDVREAMATLRDPDKRLLAELWANAPTGPLASLTDKRSTNDSAKSTNVESGRRRTSYEPEAFPSAMAALRLR